MPSMVPVVLCVVALAATACGKPESGTKATTVAESAAPTAQPSGKVIARYAGQAFTEGQFRDEMAQLSRRARGALSDPERRRQFVDNFILSRLIYDRGVANGYDKDPEVQKQLEDLKRRLVVQRVMQEQQSAPVEDAEVQAYYDTHQAEFATDRVKASHILVADEALAKDIRAKLTANPGQFENLAKEHSIDKANADKGGDLGFFGRGRMVKEFEDAAFALTEDGQISDPIQTRFGYHVIKRTEREEGKVKPFEEVKSQIRIRLMNEKRRQRTEEFLAKLKQEADYQVDVDVLTAVPLDDLPEPENVPDLPPGH